MLSTEQLQLLGGAWSQSQSLLQPASVLELSLEKLASGVAYAVLSDCPPVEEREDGGDNAEEKLAKQRERRKLKKQRNKMNKRESKEQEEARRRREELALKLRNSLAKKTTKRKPRKFRNIGVADPVADSFVAEPDAGDVDEMPVEADRAVTANDPAQDPAQLPPEPTKVGKVKGSELVPQAPEMKEKADAEAVKAVKAPSPSTYRAPASEMEMM